LILLDAAEELAGLELHPEGGGYRLSVTRVDGKDRRQVGGFHVRASELPVVTATLRALEAYVRAAA
jgi:hypothetical protein